jgi:hypothetical protein
VRELEASDSVLAYVAHPILNSLKAIDHDNHWYRRHLATLPVTRPSSSPLAHPVGLGTEPLPNTAEEFVAETLKRQPS